MIDINKSLYRFMRDYKPKQNQLAVIRGARKIRYKSFFRQIDRVAGGLYALGVRKGDVVMVALPNIEQAVVAIYAISKLGAVASMIHPKLQQTEFRKQVKLQNPKVVFISEINHKQFSAAAGDAKKVFCSFWFNIYLNLPISKKFEEYEGDGSEPALYMHSGGTSGVPKTVVIPARAANALVDNLMNTMVESFSEKDAMLVTLPMFHGFGLCVGVHTALSANIQCVLQPRFSGKRTLHAIKHNKITTMIAVPAMLKKLLQTPGFFGKNIKTLKNIYVGGDAVSQDLEEAFNSRLKAAGAPGLLSAGYGLTETMSVCVVQNGVYKRGTVGKPLNGVSCAIVDENMNRLPVGEVGELIVGGLQTMSGYLGENGAVLENGTLFNADGKQWVKTGDYFKQDKNGFLYFMGRKKRLIKISGMNVFPTEIERVAKEMPYVGECAAIETSKGGKTFIMLLLEGEFTEKQKREVEDHIKHNLSHWHWPKFVVARSTFPRTQISKIDIMALQKEYAQLDGAVKCREI
jgi:long-chain acyl-CoA synthetase